MYFLNKSLFKVGSWCGVRSDGGWVAANEGRAWQRVQRPFTSGPSMGDMTLQPVGPDGATVSFAAEDDPGGTLLLCAHVSCPRLLFSRDVSAHTYTLQHKQHKLSLSLSLSLLLSCSLHPSIHPSVSLLFALFIVDITMTPFYLYSSCSCTLRLFLFLIACDNMLHLPISYHDDNQRLFGRHFLPTGSFLQVMVVSRRMVLPRCQHQSRRAATSRSVSCWRGISQTEISLMRFWATCACLPTAMSDTRLLKPSLFL